MVEEHLAFVGSVPGNYDKYLGPLIFDVYAEDLATRILVPENGILIETAAGTGLATRYIRNRLSTSVRVVATDLNADMLKIAESKFSDSENIESQIADAQNLNFSDSSFDSMACQFSLMFFPDKLAAIKEAARVLKPGGSFHFNIWDSLEYNDYIRVTNKVIQSYFKESAPDFFDTPYGHFKIDEYKESLGIAGFNDVEISVLPKVSKAFDARQVALGYVLGTPVRLQIESREPNSLSDIVDSVEQAIGKEFGTSQLSAKMQAIVFTAHL